MTFDNSPASVELLEAVSAFADTVLAPTVVSVGSHFLDLGRVERIDRLAYLAHHIEDNPVYAKWNRLRSLPEANWLVAACNGFLARPRYAGQSAARDVLFEEASPLWISPVWAVGTLAAQSAVRIGWPTRLSDGDADASKALPFIRRGKARRPRPRQFFPSTA
jgi:predicted component of type VI protein secretion system